MGNGNRFSLTSLSWLPVLTALLGAGCLSSSPPPPTDTPSPIASVSADGEIELPVSTGAWTRGKIFGAENQRSETGILFVTGVDGGDYEPVDGIYSRMGRRFAPRGMTSIFVQYRQPGVLEESVQDALAGIRFLKERGVKRIALVGWSFGGAVIVHSAARTPEVVTVVGLAPQSIDTEPVAQFDRQSILLIHSTDDENVPFSASEQILAEVPAGVRAELFPLSGHLHALDTAVQEIDSVVEGWLTRELQY